MLKPPPMYESTCTVVCLQGEIARHGPPWKTSLSVVPPKVITSIRPTLLLVAASRSPKIKPDSSLYSILAQYDAMGQDCPPHGTPEPSPVEHETQKQLATDTSASETKRIRFYHRGTLGVNVEGVVAAGQNDYVEDVVDNSSTEIALNILLEDSRLNMEAIDPPWPSHSNSIHIDGQTQRHIKLGRLCQLVCSFVTHMFDKWGINVPPNLFVTEMIKKETQGWSVLLQRR